MRRFILLVAGVLFVGLVPGCDSVPGIGGSDGLDTRGATTVEVKGLAVHFFGPDTVAVADSFNVRVIVQNQTFEKRAVTTSNTCLVEPGVFDDEGTRVPFRGSVHFCGAAVTTHEFPPADTKERRFDVQAAVFTGEGNKPVSPGTYTLQVPLDWTIDEKRVERSAIRKLVVRR